MWRIKVAKFLTVGFPFRSLFVLMTVLTTALADFATHVKAAELMGQTRLKDSPQGATEPWRPE
jgi:hypothetical protein